MAVVSALGYPDGFRVVADTEGAATARGFVGRCRHPTWGRAVGGFIRATGDDFRAIVKLFLGTVEGVEGRLFLVGQLVPTVVSLIPEREVTSLHCVVGSCGSNLAWGEDERLSR